MHIILLQESLESGKYSNLVHTEFEELVCTMSTVSLCVVRTYMVCMVCVCACAHTPWNLSVKDTLEPAYYPLFRGEKFMSTFDMSIFDILSLKVSFVGR